MIDELRPAVYTKCNSVTGLSGGLWWVEASQAATDNYSVFSIVTNTNTRDTATKFEKVFLQINIYSLNPSTLESLTKGMLAKLDDTESSWSLTSYHFIRIERNFVRGPYKPNELYQTVIQYEIDLQKK